MNATNELKNYDNWVLWGVAGKPLKAPIDAKTGYGAKANDSTTWATWEQAIEGFKRFKAKGFGFELTVKDGIVCIDLDKCITDGVISTEAMAIVRLLNSYTEISQSGRGLHIFVKGKAPSNIGDREGCPIEMYSHGRYIAITANHLEGTPESIEHRPAELMELYNRYNEQKTINNQPVRNYTADDMPSTADIAEMLSHIPASLGYEDWNKICMAVHSAYPNHDGINLIVNWSGSAFKENDPQKVMEAKFKSYDTSGAIGIGSLVYYAKQYGWQPTPRQQEQIVISKAELQQRIDQAFYDGFRSGLEYGRQLWLKEGISESELDYFQLGYDESHDALTVPFFDLSGELINVEYRNGSINYETDNTPFFVASQGVVSAPYGIITIDSLSAMKTYTTAASASIQAGIGEPIVFGLPQEKLTDSTLLDQLDCDKIYVVAHEGEDMSGRGLGQLRGRVRYVRTPWPIEQMAKQMTVPQLLWYLNQGIS